MLSPETITAAQFDSTLLCYPALLKALSASKTVRDEKEESLEELDWFRFMSAPNRYMKREGDKKDVPLEKDDVVRLVKWKLKHGKYRPNLLKLVEGNAPQGVAATSLAAFAMKDNISSIRTMSLLSGVGPATASLLLSVHDPDNVIFFSDEAYRWLVCGGKEQPIKYTLKEYEQLEVRAKELMDRLGVGAREVERTAFVIMRGGGEDSRPPSASSVQDARTTPSQRRKSSNDLKATKPASAPHPVAHKSKSTSVLKPHKTASSETLSTTPRRPRPTAKLPESEIPDPKTLARRASQRLRAANPPPPRPERPRTAEEKLETVIEDLKCKGAALKRVVSPPPLRNRRFSRVGGEECKGMMEKLEEKPVSVAPLLEKREEEREETEEREEKEEVLEERVDEKKHRLLGKRDGSPKEKEKVEREKGEKRARRGRSRRSEEKDDPEGVGCSAGCFQMLGRNG